MDAMKKLVLFLIFFILTVAIASVIYLYVANPPEETQLSGTITGRVTNATSDAPIQFASVTATGSAGFGSDTTDANGDYTINTGLGKGTYTVNVTATGFDSQDRAGVSVTINQVTHSIDFLLTTTTPSRKIYIRSDGTIDPSNASIRQVGNTYTFTGDMFGNIVVEKEDITIDGNGFKLGGYGEGGGIDLNYYQGNASFAVHNVTIRNITIQNYTTGIVAGGGNIIFGNTLTGNMLAINLNGDDCHIYGNKINDNEIAISSGGRNVIYGNTMTDNDNGIQGTCRYSPIFGNNITNTSSDAISLSYSNNNTISHNTIANSGRAAIRFIHCWDNDISENNIVENGRGLDFFFDSTASYNNTIVSNNFVNNGVQVLNGNVSVNFWDNDVNGNYWSDYTGIDSNSDGIGDTPYVIDANNKDRYPLREPSSIP